MPTGAITEREIASQPTIWAEAAELARQPAIRQALMAPGDSVLALGCGTSAFVAMAYAHLREHAGLGRTDWAYASELPGPEHTYDRVLAFTRSGTTTEVLDAYDVLPDSIHRVVVTGVTDSPVAQRSHDVIDLGFADETSVVQTRFPTATLIMARVGTGELDEAALAGLISAAEDAVEADLPDVSDVDHLVFLGTGWSLGLAHEAALKVRESAMAWAESYPSADYRHGPLAVAHEQSRVTLFGTVPSGLPADIAVTNATVHVGEQDPLVELITAQRIALQLARQKGLDPDNPKFLTRSVVLEQE